MARIEMRFNGRKIASAAQLQRELTRSMEKHVEDSLKKAAGPGVRMKKTRVVGDNHLDRHRQASWPPPPAVGRA